MRLPVPQLLAPIIQVFSRGGVPLYAVGGLVRNTLLHVPPSDIDVCSRVPPADLDALCAGTPIRMIPKAAAFGTVELHAPGGLHVEHTTFRSDVYAPGGSHRPENVRFSHSLEADAFRRDFTVNALYLDLVTGEVLDPTGGLQDLEEKLLRTTSPDPETILRSDALRVLRLIRFASQLGFFIHPDTLACARENVGLLGDIAPERKQAEFSALLLCDGKYPGLEPGKERSVLAALERIDALGAWPYLIPELEACRGAFQRPDHHRYDVLGHLYHACAAMPPRLELRLAGLLHDVGKPPCRAENGNMYDHDQYSRRMSREILTRLRYPKAVVDGVSSLVGAHMYDVQNAAKDSTLRVKFAHWGRAFTEEMILMREADFRGCGYTEDYVATRWRALYNRMQQDGTPFSLAELAVTGKDLMEALSLAEGGSVGRMKEQLFRHAAKHPEDNNREALLEKARSYLASGGKV